MAGKDVVAVQIVRGILRAHALRLRRVEGRAGQERAGPRVVAEDPPAADDPFHRGQILAPQDIRGAERRVMGLEQAGVPAHGRGDRQETKRRLEPLLIRPRRQVAHIRCSRRDPGPHPLLAQAGQGGHPLRAAGLDEGLGAVSHPEIPFHRAFGVGLGQSFPDHLRPARRAMGQRMHVGRGAPHVDHQQITPAGTAARPFGQEFRGPQRRGRRRHRRCRR